METWFLILVTLSVSFLIVKYFLLNIFSISRKQPRYNLPPTPPTLPIVGNFTWVRKTGLEIEGILRSLIPKLGPAFTLLLGRRLTVLVADGSLVHQALVQNGAVFADRPPYYTTEKIVNGDQVIISASFYGPTWRLLRRNLTSEILHPSRVRSYSHARKWVLQVIQNRLESESKTTCPILVYEHFHFAMFCLLVLMCFGDKLGEDMIRQIEVVQRQLLIAFTHSNALNLWPSVTKILWRKKWEKLYQLRKQQEQILLPLIRARKKLQEERASNKTNDDEYVLSYVDTLFGLELPAKKRKLDEGEIVNLASEFLNAGTDSTATALEWIMANLVKYPEIQERLFMEIKAVVGDTEEGELEEMHLQKMPYLKAVILEGLRRHPPAHFVLPHAVTQDTVLDKYYIPKGANFNVMVAVMARDPKVWEDPTAFRPERFLQGGDGEGVDITGSREIKMMPFGAGRRICPGLGLAMLHLEYLVANLVWRFQWDAVDGYGVDLSEKQDFTIVMKNPLQAFVSLRFK